MSLPQPCHPLHPCYVPTHSPASPPLPHPPSHPLRYSENKIFPDPEKKPYEVWIFFCFKAKPFIVAQFGFHHSVGQCLKYLSYEAYIYTHSPGRGPQLDAKKTRNRISPGCIKKPTSSDFFPDKFLIFETCISQIEINGSRQKQEILHNKKHQSLKQ